MRRTTSSPNSSLRERLVRLEAARETMLEIKALGIELKAFSERGRVGFRPRGLMPLPLFRRLRECERLILLLLTLPEVAIPPDTAPGHHERCIVCGACIWLCLAGVYQCGLCHALWRPLPTPATRMAGHEQEQEVRVAQ